MTQNSQGYKDPDYLKNWRKANPDKVRAQQQAYYHRTKEDQKRRATAWQKANPERIALIRKARAANLRYPGRISSKDVDLVLQRNGTKCHWCGKPDLKGRDLTLEHLKPINDVRYLTIACLSCNASRAHSRDGRRFTEAELRQHNVDRASKWQAEHQDQRRIYMREYMKARRAAKKVDE